MIGFLDVRAERFMGQRSHLATMTIISSLGAISALFRPSHTKRLDHDLPGRWPGGLTRAGLVDSGSPARYRLKPFLRTEGLLVFRARGIRRSQKLVLSLVE